MATDMKIPPVFTRDDRSERPLTHEAGEALGLEQRGRLANVSALAADAAQPTSAWLAEALLTQLDQVFTRLSAANIPFCLLRNRDLIPFGLLTRSDVDLVLPEGITRNRLITLMNDLDPVQIVSYRDVVHSFYFPVGPIFLLVDFLVGDQEYRGARYLSDEDILTHAYQDRGMIVASEVHQAFLAWFQKLLWSNGSFPMRYGSLITAAIHQTPGAFQGLLNHAFGRRLADELWTLAAENRLAESTGLASRCRRVVWLRALRRRPLDTLRGAVKQVVSAATSRMTPAGLDVAILGPDGAGKSTICSLLVNADRVSLPFKDVEHTLLYLRVLPPLAKTKSALLRQPIAEHGVSWDPHGRPGHTSFVSAFKFLYYTLDQWLGEIIRARPRLAKNVLLMRDRHLLEIVIDPKRYRYAGPMWLARWITRMMPKPDMVILLDADPQILQARKQEVSFAETVRQRNAYKEIIERMPNGYVIDAGQPLEQVLADVRATIVTTVSARTRRRLGLERSPW